MKISVIIPVYKAEKYLKRCIDSVIHQTYRDLEIILVDDGSPDKCGEICDEYAHIDCRIKVIHKVNEGVSVARNYGINIATGSYLFFMDADDVIHCEAVDILLKHAIELGGDITIGNYSMYTQDEKTMSAPPFSQNVNYLIGSPERFKYFFGNCYGAPVWNRLYKSSFVRTHNVLFEREVFFGEDFLFNVQLFIHCPRITLVNEYTYLYYQNTESITNSYKSNMVQQYLSLLSCFYEYAQNHHRLKENEDLIAFSAFTSIDSNGLNTYIYSKNKFRDLKYQLKRFKKSILTNQALRRLAMGKHLRSVPRIDWKYYAWVFSFVYSLNLISLATLIQLTRFKIKNVAAKDIRMAVEIDE